MNIEGWFCRHGVTSLVTSSPWKYFFLNYLHTIVPYPMSNWGYRWNFLKSWKFQKCRNCEVLAKFFVGSVIGNWVCYINSRMHYLHFELLIDTVAQILTELWQFQNLTYFLTSWPNYLIFDLHKNGFLAMTKLHIWVKFGDDWSNDATCILLTTFIRTDRQTDRQNVRRTYLPKLKNLASNEKAIRDCVLAKISKIMITRNIMTTIVMNKNILKSV